MKAAPSSSGSGSTHALPKIYSTLDEIQRDLLQQRQVSSEAADANNSALNNNQANHVRPSDVEQYKQPQLFLHFDVNETILIGDPAGGDTVLECLNKILAKSAFVSTIERDNSHEENDGDSGSKLDSSKELVRSPSSGNITESSTHNLHPTHWWNGSSLSSKEAPPLYTGWTWPSETCPYYRTGYKKLAKKFTEGHGRVYQPLYEELCAKLGLDHEIDENAAANDVFANFVPAFFYTLQYYFPSKSTSVNPSSETKARDNYLPPPPKVTLVLRTFGTDLPRVAACISEFAKGNHPSFPGYYNPDLILDGDLFCSSWTYRDSHGNIVQEGIENAELVYELHSTTADIAGNHSQNRTTSGDHTGDDSILNYLQAKTIVGIQDCYPFWRENSHAPWAGKPVWARTNTNSYSRHDHHHILLDDNIHNDPNDGAGGIRIPKGLEGEGSQRHTSYESLHGNEGLNMHGKHLIRVPAVCPLMDDDWFIRRIEEARWKYFEEDVRGKVNE